jgi:hypothetical protein
MNPARLVDRLLKELWPEDQSGEAGDEVQWFKHDVCSLRGKCQWGLLNLARRAEPRMRTLRLDIIGFKVFLTGA